MTTEITGTWKEFHKELKVFIYNKTRNTADTDDILQEVFIKIIRNFEKVSESQNMRSYIYGIVRNAINDHFRSRKQKFVTNDDDEIFSIEDTNNLNATVAECCIKPFINKLPEHYREALLIVEFQDLSQKQLAEKLGISYSGAKSRVQRGKEKLKELILECCAYESDNYGNLLGTEKTNCNCS